MKKQNNLKLLDVALFLLFMIILFFTRQDFAVIISFIFVIPYLYFTKRKEKIKFLLAAFIISFIWILITKDQYSYNKEIISLFGISTFPLFMWSLGLFFIYLLYHYFSKFLRKPNFSKNLLLFIAFFWPILIAFETVNYHIFGTKNMPGKYPGLPICDCIHAPRWMQISYFLIGIIYFIFCFFISSKMKKKK
jgi:hypothetical protein